MTEKFDIVLYYDSLVFVKPSFDDVKASNPELNTDDILDIYSDLLNKYQNKITVPSHTFILDDENFISNVQEFEKNDFFIEWDKSSKKTIEEIIKKCITTQSI